MRFRKRSGSGSQARKQQRDWKRSVDHHANDAIIAAMDRLHDDALLVGPGCTHDTSPPADPALRAPPSETDKVYIWFAIGLQEAENVCPKVTCRVA